MVREYRFGRCVVHVWTRRVVTRFPDGALLAAVPERTQAQRDMASYLGYPDDVLMTQEHDPVHSFLAAKLDLPWSPVLWAVAHGTLFEHNHGAEEAMGLEFQRYLNTREAYWPALERLAGLGLPALRREALEVLRGSRPAAARRRAGAHAPGAEPGVRHQARGDRLRWGMREVRDLRY